MTFRDKRSSNWASKTHHGDPRTNSEGWHLDKGDTDKYFIAECWSCNESTEHHHHTDKCVNCGHVLLSMNRVLMTYKFKITDAIIAVAIVALYMGAVFSSVGF